MNMLGDADVLRTFNDYTEESNVSFVKIVVGKNHPWSGRRLRECVMPREFLVVLLLRGEDVIVPNGNTVVNAGDVLVTAAPEFENREEFGMFEEYIGKNNPWTGKRVRELELSPGTLIAMIKRGGGTVIPYVCIKIPPKEDALPPAGSACPSEGADAKPSADEGDPAKIKAHTDAGVSAKTPANAEASADAQSFGDAQSSDDAQSSADAQSSDDAQVSAESGADTAEDGSARS